MAEAVKRFHPALFMYFLTFLLLAFAILLGFIALFVPWVQKDIAVGTRAFAYPFKTCYVSTFSPVNAQSCLDNDFINSSPYSAPLTGPYPYRNASCKTLVISAIGLGFSGILCAFLIDFAVLTVLIKLWSRPMGLAIVCQIFIFIAFGLTICCWAVFIAFAEYVCFPGAIWPVRGYSYGFILFVFSSALSIAAFVTGMLGLLKLRKFRPLHFDEPEKAMHPAPYPMAYEYPVPVAPSPVPVGYYAPVPTVAY